MVYKRTKKWLQGLLRPNGKSSAPQGNHLGSSINDDPSKFELSLNVMTINYKDIKELDILSFLEIPEERRDLDFEQAGDYAVFLKQVLKIVELGLIDPKRVEEFEELTPMELGEFFGKWMQASMLTESGSDKGIV
jgi:hypothetical protein